MYAESKTWAQRVSNSGLVYRVILGKDLSTRMLKLEAGYQFVSEPIPNESPLPRRLGKLQKIIMATEGQAEVRN